MSSFIQRRNLLIASAAAVGAGSALTLPFLRPARAALPTKVVYKSQTRPRTPCAKRFWKARAAQRPTKSVMMAASPPRPWPSSVLSPA